MVFIDLHNDAVACLSPRRFSKYIKKAEKSGAETVLLSVWTTEMRNPMEKIQQSRKLIDSINTSVKLFLHIEDAWFINEQNIFEVLDVKPFSIGLTWNTNNNLAGGAHSDGRLTPLGKSIIEKLITNGIIIDLAHLNKNSFHKVANLLDGQKLFCSHTCFNEINPHPRNLDRLQIQIIVNSGGLIGLTLVGDFLSSNKRARMHDIYKHISYFIKNFGEDSLAIGTDFFGTSNLPKRLRQYKHFKRLRKFLIKEGLSETVTDKIFWKNAKGLFDSYITNRGHI